MKKIYASLSIKGLTLKQITFAAFILIALLPVSVQGSSKQWNHVVQAKQRGVIFEQANIFKNIGEIDESMRETATIGTLLQLDRNLLSELLALRPEALQIAIPFGPTSFLHISLIPNRVISEDFQVTASGRGESSIAYQPGLFFQGVIDGDQASMVAISIFENQVIGVLQSSVYGRLELGELTDDNLGRYILYRSDHFRGVFQYECQAIEDENHSTLLYSNSESTDSNRCVRIYFECEYDMFLANGSSVTQTVNFMTGVYNVIALLYQNDGIQTVISEIFVWNTPDSYATASPVDALVSFRNNRLTFNGNLAHLVSRGAPAGGGVAWVNQLCGSLPYAYSYITQSYNQFPTYSWTVMVIAHEMGHNIGSMHTHDCVWDVSNNGIANEAIDGCGPAVGYGGTGSCSTAPLPTNGGTIMSYCHLVSGVGIISIMDSEVYRQPF
jgi:hypothetical protein